MGQTREPAVIENLKDVATSMHRDLTPQINIAAEPPLSTGSSDVSRHDGSVAGSTYRGLGVDHNPSMSDQAISICSFYI